MFPKTQIFFPITTEQWLEIGKLKQYYCLWTDIQSYQCHPQIFFGAKEKTVSGTGSNQKSHVAFGPHVSFPSLYAKVLVCLCVHDLLSYAGCPLRGRNGSRHLGFQSTMASVRNPGLHWHAAGWAKALGEYWRTNNNDTYGVVCTICRALFEMLSMF